MYTLILVHFRRIHVLTLVTKLKIVLIILCNIFHQLTDLNNTIANVYHMRKYLKHITLA